MKLLTGLGTGLCLTVLCVVVAPKAKADEWNHKTTVTFSESFEVPGVGQHILPAGTYVFKLLDSPSDRHIVQIFNVREDHVYTTILAIPNYRLKATGKTVMTFRERPAGDPEALKAWFYPGHEWGEEFVYEKSRAIQLAKETNEAVLSTPLALDAAPVEALNTAPVEAVAPSGETVDTAVVVQAPPVETAAVNQAPAAAPAPAPEASLPKTASDLPLIGLAGLLMLGGGFALFGASKLKA
jgi:pyruvate/2-oxoglutarate dehydrogenase complex dihydrolipoamide acyltransferase (E2) component